MSVMSTLDRPMADGASTPAAAREPTVSKEDGPATKRRRIEEANDDDVEEAEGQLEDGTAADETTARRGRGPGARPSAPRRNWSRIHQGDSAAGATKYGGQGGVGAGAGRSGAGGGRAKGSP